MEKYSNIIAAIKNVRPIKPPNTIVEQVMASLEKIDQSTIGKIKRFLFVPQKTNPDTAGIFSGQITSYQQCAFLLLMVGFFYLVAGVVAMWGLHDALTGKNINAWLKFQPYVTIGSGLFIICAAMLIIYRPQTIALIQHTIIVHTSFIVVNAFILESILSFPVALMYIFILTVLAIIFGVLLIGSIRSVLRFRMIHEGSRCG